MLTHADICAGCSAEVSERIRLHCGRDADARRTVLDRLAHLLFVRLPPAAVAEADNTAARWVLREGMSARIELGGLRDGTITFAAPLVATSASNSPTTQASFDFSTADSRTTYSDEEDEESDEEDEGPVGIDPQMRMRQGDRKWMSKRVTAAIHNRTLNRSTFEAAKLSVPSSLADVAYLFTQIASYERSCLRRFLWVIRQPDLREHLRPYGQVAIVPTAPSTASSSTAQTAATVTAPQPRKVDATPTVRPRPPSSC